MKLRLVITVVFLTVFIIGKSTAQISIGVEGGVNIPSYTAFTPNTTYSVSTGNKTAFGVRSILDIGLSESISLRSGIGFIQRGGSVASNLNASDYKASISFTYLEFPILAKYCFSTSTLRPYIFAGPNIGIFLSGSSEASFGGQTFKEDLPNRLVQTVNLGLEFGAGLLYSLTPTINLTANAGYTAGLVNIATILSGTAKTNDIRIQIGVLFAFK